MNRFYTYLSFLPFALPILWVLMQFDVALNSDHAWLLEAAQRLLNGEPMSTSFFDPNPPLSVLLYVPSVWLMESGIIDKTYAHYVLTAICVFLGTFILNNLLKRFESLDRDARSVLVFGFICANTILTSSGELYFGERDQFIFIGLIILSALQILITHEKQTKASIKNALIVTSCTWLILLKPHYFIIPFLFLLHRLIITKHIKSCIVSMDTIFMSLTTSIYLFIVFVFFTDYITDIFPVFQTAYLSSVNPDVMQIGFLYTSLILISMILTSLMGLPFDKIKAPLVLFSIALLCCFLFWIQMKGIYYQLLPALGFWVCGLGLLILNTGQHYFKNSPFMVPISMLITLTICFALKSPSTALSHSDYKEMPITQKLEECAHDCSFYMFTNNMDTIHQLAFYSGAEHASRFPVFWWLDYALRHPESGMLEKFRTKVINDLKRHRPKYLIIANNLELDDRSFSLISYLSESSDFIDFMQSYKIIEQPWKHSLLKPSAFDIYQKEPS